MLVFGYKIPAICTIIWNRDLLSRTEVSLRNTVTMRYILKFRTGDWVHEGEKVNCFDVMAGSVCSSMWRFNISFLRNDLSQILHLNELDCPAIV